MGTSLQDKETPPDFSQASVTLHLRPALEITDEQLYELSQINRDLRFERNAQGELIIMSPTGGETGNKNAELTIQLGVWAKQNGTGLIFDSSTGFRLPNGAVRSPDASWMKKSRYESLSKKVREKFIPLCPDFVIELRSLTDPINILKDKMQEYIDSGAQLGFLIDPEGQRVYVYRPDTQVEEMDKPETISGEPVLPGFVLDLREIW